MKQMVKKYILNSVLLAGIFSLAACTDGFDNVNPYQPTEDMLEGDNFKVGAFFPQLQQNVVSTHNNQFQLSQNLIGDIYSGYMATPNPFNSNKNNSTYFFQDNWLNDPFQKVYTKAVGAYMEIKKNTGGAENSHVYQLGQIIKIASMHRFTDMWGPLPYSQVGKGSMSAPYDSQETVYRSFFDELTKAIDVLTTFTINNPDSKPMAVYDLVYGGDYTKWVKYANSLKLRLAMRIAYVAPDLARKNAEEAIAHPIGVILDNGDNAAVKSTSTISVKNQLWTMASSYNDIRMGASIQSILTGYEDPRLPILFQQVTINDKAGYYGVRTGINISKKEDYTPFSTINMQISDPIVWLNAAEVAFLRAEGAIRNWDMKTSAQEAYQNGVRLSFMSYGVGGDADTYMKNNTKKAANYTDPKKTSNNSNAVSQITIAWNEIATFEEKLERIITQKWIAIFPDGQEAWSEFRRTGYPKLFPVVINNSGGTISNEVQIRRMPFPKSEYTLNKVNLENAIVLLGGSDNGGTRLWWDAKK